jgi:hypothetical protein
MFTSDFRQPLRCPIRTPTALQTCLRHVVGVSAGAILLATAVPASAQLPSTPDVVTTELVEWDVTPFGDFVPGGLAVDDTSSSRFSKVWFATRAGAVRLYRLTPGLNFKKDYAAAKSWDLGGDLTGGVRLRHSNDGRFAFVNVNKTDQTGASTGRGGIVAIDTKDDSRITWATRPAFFHLSDVSVDTRDGGTTVFTAAPYYDPYDFSATISTPVDGVVERLRPRNPEWRNGKLVVPAEITRYPVGGGAGSCEDSGVGAPCIPGIAVDKRRGHPIYVSQPRFTTVSGTFPAIAEIDPRLVKCPNSSDPYPKCVRVRHWPLPAELAGPREINVDHHGKLWGITTSGLLFSLEVQPNCDRATLTRHDPLGPIDPEDLFAVAPDGGIVGFTDSNNNEVSVLFPEQKKTPVSAVITYIKPVTKLMDGTREVICPEDHVVEPRYATASGYKYRKEEDGTYVETDVSTGMSASPDDTSMPSFTPTGIAADGVWKTGAFFYGVTFSGGTNRIGHLSLRVDHDKDIECRRGQHDSDHDGVDDKDDGDVDGDNIPNELDDDSDNDTIPDILDRDKNDDGIEDEYQKPGHRETKRSDKGQMGAGESKAYEMEYDAHSVSLLAIVEAADATAPLSIEIVDDTNTVLVSTPPAVGKAIATAVPAVPGVYTIRVKNAGQKSVSYKTTIIGSKIPY